MSIIKYSHRYRNFSSLADGGPFGGSCQIHGPVPIPQPTPEELPAPGDGEQIKSPVLRNPAFSHSRCPPEIHKSCFCVRFIAEHTKMLEDSTKVKKNFVKKPVKILKMKILKFWNSNQKN